MRKYIPIFILLIAVGSLLGPLSQLADACPMCRNANETDNLLPRAYMYSIIFMISMPAIIFTGFSVTFYRLHKKSQAMEQTDLQLPEEPPLNSSNDLNPR